MIAVTFPFKLVQLWSTHEYSQLTGLENILSLLTSLRNRPNELKKIDRQCYLTETAEIIW